MAFVTLRLITWKGKQSAKELNNPNSNSSPMVPSIVNSDHLMSIMMDHSTDVATETEGPSAGENTMSADIIEVQVPCTL